jgi:hypothetical protein
VAVTEPTDCEQRVFLLRQRMQALGMPADRYTDQELGTIVNAMARLDDLPAAWYPGDGRVVRGPTWTRPAPSAYITGLA